MKMVHIIGGNVNGKLNHWLRQLHIYDFVHVALDTNSIDPLELQKSAVNIKQYVEGASALIAVGQVADRLLFYAHLDHGTLPPTNEKNFVIIAKSLDTCRQYLTRRMIYVASITNPSPSGGPPSSS